MLINPLLVEFEIEKRLRAFNLPVRIRRTPAENANAPVNKTELWVRYVDSDYDAIANADDLTAKSYNRKMLFHVITEVVSLQNHERALTLHNNAIALLTGWRPKIKVDSNSTSCVNGFADIVKCFDPIKDRFERYAEGKYQYRLDLTITVPHSRIEQVDLTPFNLDWTYNNYYADPGNPVNDIGSPENSISFTQIVPEIHIGHG
jgi:hypothetical protein